MNGLTLKDVVHPWHPRKKGSLVIVIPKIAREQMGIKPGEPMTVTIEGESLIYTRYKYDAASPTCPSPSPSPPSPPSMSASP